MFAKAIKPELQCDQFIMTYEFWILSLDMDLWIFLRLIHILSCLMERVTGQSLEKECWDVGIYGIILRQIISLLCAL